MPQPGSNSKLELANAISFILNQDKFNGLNGSQMCMAGPSIKVCFQHSLLDPKGLSVQITRIVASTSTARKLTPAKRKPMKIKYNAPVILTYTLIALCILAFCPRGTITSYFTSPALLEFSSLKFYARLLSYIAGHGDWSHLMGNITIILLVGPLLEEKYGSGKLLEMIIVTAAATGLFNAFLFSNSIMGGSGIAFMLILLSSFANIRGQIPLTFILVALLFIGSEVISILKIDQISQFSHLAGGGAGAAYGFLRGGRR